jgi:hypothetical protein
MCLFSFHWLLTAASFLFFFAFSPRSQAPAWERKFTAKLLLRPVNLPSDFGEAEAKIIIYFIYSFFVR